MPECTAQTKAIGGYSIPAGTAVVIDTRQLNNNTSTFGKDSTEFNPDRFLRTETEKLRCGFMRFGAGAAAGRCLGKNAADVLFKMVTVAILQEFTLSVVQQGGEHRDAQIKLTRSTR